MLIPGPGRQFFIQWNMAASALTLVILLSNTTGGTFLGSVLQLGGVVLAWAWSLASLCAFPDNRPGLAFMFAPIALFGFGMIQLSPAFTVLGLTTLITYPQVVLGYYWNHITLPPQVFSDSPLVFATRTLVASAIGCGFALAFTVLIFPRSAKAALRRDVAHVFEVIGEIGTLLNTAAAGKDAGGAPALDAKEGEAYTVLLAQEQQLAFAKAEIAIGLPVDEAAYRTVMQKLYGVLDRLVAVGVSYPEGEHLAHVKGLADVTAGMVMDSWMCAESVRGGRRMPEAREQWVEADEGGDDRDCATVEEVTLIAFVKAVNYVAGELSSLRGTINDVVGRL
ncbi:hypothetical protein DFJ74DRAFT_671412 [Hyaloraphidium curvatum]|nr:hypothetical protein DFJ74DRAFT_671412 [Hyaloraphidium curvatum]